MKYMSDWEIYFLLYNGMNKVQNIITFFSTRKFSFDLTDVMSRLPTELGRKKLAHYKYY